MADLKELEQALVYIKNKKMGLAPTLEETKVCSLFYLSYFLHFSYSMYSFFIIFIFSYFFYQVET